MRIQREPGTRGAVPENDRKLFVVCEHCGRRELWGYETQLADLLVAFAENEDAIYPPPRWKGKRYLVRFTTEVIMLGKEEALRLTLKRKDDARQHRFAMMDVGEPDA